MGTNSCLQAESFVPLSRVVLRLENPNSALQQFFYDGKRISLFGNDNFCIVAGTTSNFFNKSAVHLTARPNGDARGTGCWAWDGKRFESCAQPGKFLTMTPR